MSEPSRWISLEAEHWNETGTAFKKHLLLYGETYAPEALFATVPVPHDVTTVSYG